MRGTREREREREIYSLALAVFGSQRKWWVPHRIHFLHPVSVTAPCKAQVPREARWLRRAPLGGLTTRKHRLQRLEICKNQKTKNHLHQHPHTRLAKMKANVPCRQIGHELDSSSSQGSTQAWWKTCLPSHGSTRTSSPSSKSTIHIGHVSRPIDSGSGSSSCADADADLDDPATANADGPARGRAGGTSASSSCSFCGTSSIPPASASIPPVAVDCNCDCDCDSSISAFDAGSRGVSLISCPGCCPSPCASTSFPPGSALRPTNLISGNVSRIARVRTAPRPAPPTSPVPAATR